MVTFCLRLELTGPLPVKLLASLIATMCDAESHPDLEAYVSVSGLHSNHLQITFLPSNIHKLGAKLSRGSIILPWISIGASARCKH